jgi:hypothetical protein
MLVHRLTFNPFQVEQDGVQQIDPDYSTGTAASHYGICCNTSGYLPSKVEHVRSGSYLSTAKAVPVVSTVY